MRYDRTPLLNLGQYYGTSEFIPQLRKAIAAGIIRYNEHVLVGKERLDTLAAEFYGNPLLYDVLAAASDIGNCLQVPPGTTIIVPNIDDVRAFL
jgi:hypothetical protein